jgi:hypothetical protein
MDEIFEVQSPFSGWALLSFLPNLLAALVFLAFTLFATTIPKYSLFGAVGSVIMLLVIVLFLWSELKLKAMKYIVSDSAIRIPGNRLAHMQGEIPFSMISGVELVPAPKNLFEGLFTSARINNLMQRSFWSLASTQIMRNVVFVHTNYVKGPFPATFVFSPKDKEGFIKCLQRKIPKLKQNK